jgi:hypothetical protein
VRIDRVKDSAVRICGGMVDFVYNDVVEVLRVKPSEVLSARQLRDRGKHQLRVQLGFVADEPAHPGDLARSANQAAVRVRCLPE